MDRLLAEAEAVVEPGHEGWTSFRFDLEIPPGIYVIRPHSARGVLWGGSRTSDPRVRLARLTERDGWWVIPGVGSLRVSPRSYPCPPEAVVDGVARPDRRGAHMWMSDPEQPLPQWIELALPEPTVCGEVSLAFDTHLDHQNYRRQVPEPQCVRDYVIKGLPADGGEPCVIAEVTGNFQRRRTHSFTPRRLRGVRLEVVATNGDPSARVFEIRVNRATE